MSRLFCIIICLGCLLLPAYADIVPVAGSTSGTFTNASSGTTASGNTWQESTYWTTVFAGVGSFNTFTPKSLDFGSITLTNFNAVSGGQQGTFTADLGVMVNFTTPSGQVANFSDGLSLSAKPGNGNSDDLSLAISSLPGPQSFTVGSEIYTVSYDGFFSSNASETGSVDTLSVSNRNAGRTGSDTDVAYLWGTITAADPAPVPEPASLVLLGTIVVGLVHGLRKQKRAELS